MLGKNKPFIVAEISANHKQNYKQAIALINAAKQAGADAVKFQTYTPEDIAVDVPIESGPWAGRSYHDLYREGALPWTWHETLFGHAINLGMVAFSTPFSPAAVKRLESIRCPMYKIASMEIGYLPLIAAAAKTGKPLIISTGMATWEEILRASKTARDNGATEVVFLHCLSAYPALTVDFNMETLRRMEACGFRVGLSDHSQDNIAAIMATTMGAEVIEKHLTLDRNDGGIDSFFSLEPHEFKNMVEDVRATAAAMGEIKFGPRTTEKDSEQYRRSIWIVKDMEEGEPFSEENLAILRPNKGLHPQYWDKIIGKFADRRLKAKTPMDLGYIL